MPNKNQQILVVTVQELWGGGSHPERAPGKTLLAYINAGYELSLISTSRNNERYRKLSPTGTILTILPFVRTKWSRAAVRTVWWSIIFPICALLVWIFRFRAKKFAFIYGYEIHGVLAGKLISMVSHAPLVARFQGTVLAPIIWDNATRKRWLSKVDHMLAMRLRADVAIITDDGTYGYQVYQELNRGKTTEVAFFRNGVNTPQHETAGFSLRRRLGYGDDALLVMTVSRLVHWKRVERALRTFAAAEHRPNSGLCILGDGPERANLEALSRKLGIESYTHFLGNVPHDEVASYLTQADVFLSFYDLSNLGNPIFESMMSGVAILTLNSGNTSSVIKHGENGLLLFTWDENLAASWLSDLLTNVQLREGIAQGAQEYAFRHLWTWDDRMKAEIDLVQHNL